MADPEGIPYRQAEGTMIPESQENIFGVSTPHIPVS